MTKSGEPERRKGEQDHRADHGRPAEPDDAGDDVDQVGGQEDARDDGHAHSPGRGQIRGHASNDDPARNGEQERPEDQDAEDRHGWASRTS